MDGVVSDQFIAQLSYMKGPELVLRVPRVVPDNAPALFYAVQGDIDGIKSLFSKGLASPYDVALTNGRTALHYAVNYKHRELLRLLIDTGASPDVEDKSKSTTIALSWTARRAPTTASRTIEGIPNTSKPHYQNHRAALETLLAKDPLLSPSRLAYGGTVSHVAAARADAETFLLLADKADLSLIGADELDNDGRSFRDVFETRGLLTEEL